MAPHRLGDGRAVGRCGCAELARQPTLELRPVGEPGEWIVERPVCQFGEAVLESRRHGVHHARDRAELPVTVDFDAMSETVDRELFEPQFEVPERDVERPAQVPDEHHRGRDGGDEHDCDEEQDPVRSLGHRGGVDDEPARFPTG